MQQTTRVRLSIIVAAFVANILLLFIGLFFQFSGETVAIIVAITVVSLALPVLQLDLSDFLRSIDTEFRPTFVRDYNHANETFRLFPFVQDEIKRTGSSYQRYVHLASRGILLIENPVNRRNQLIEIVRSADETIDSVNFIHLDWWTGGVGQNYITENLNAARRGVKIRRVFIIPTRDTLDDWRPIFEELTSHGNVEVRYREVNKRPLMDIPKENLLLVDDKIVAGSAQYTASDPSDGDEIGYVALHDVPDSLYQEAGLHQQRRRMVFDAWWEDGTPYERAAGAVTP